MATRINHVLPAHDLYAGDHVFKLSDPEALRAVYESICAYHALFPAPVYLNHNPDGIQFGEVESYELRQDGNEKTDGIYATWKIAENIDPGTIPKFASLRLVWGHMADGVQRPGYRASNGEIFPIVVIELSATGTPVFDIGQNPGITLSLSQTGTESGAPVYEFATPLGENGMTPEQINAAIAAALETMLAPLLARLDALEAAGAAPPADAAPAPPAPVETMANPAPVPVDPMKEAEALMSRAKEVGAYVAELSQKHGANPNVMRNLDVVQEQFMRHGRADAEKLVSRFVSTPTAGKVSDASLSQPGGSFTDTTGMTPMQRAKAIQKQKGCSWENACREAGVPVGTVYANL